MRQLAPTLRWLLVAAMTAAPAALVAQNGIVTGRVIDKASGLGIPAVQVTVAGTAIRTQSNDSGVYRMRNVPAGTQHIHAIRLGYTANDAVVSVSALGTVTADITLNAASVTLTTVEVTGTGQQKSAREVATLTPSITPDSLNLAASPNFASVLEASTPGVQVVQSSGTTGTGARIRIRGASSVSLSNEPLIVIDGVEVDNNANPQTLTVGVGGQMTSRLNDINPDEIDNIQTLQGPAATGLYGTAAANGVIVITTKRGQSGKAHWDGFIENGEIHDDNNYPNDIGTFFSIQPAKGPPIHLTPNNGGCALWNQAEGECTIDSLAVFNPLNSAVSPLRVGRRQEYNLSTSGGSDVNQYFVAGDYQLENGTLQNNQLQKTNARANFSTRPTSDPVAVIQRRLHRQ